MSNLRIGDKILIPAIIDKIIGNFYVFNLKTYPRDSDWCMDECVASKCILIERDGKPVPAPGDLVQIRGLKYIVIGKKDKEESARICIFNNNLYGDMFERIDDMKVIGRNGELLPKKAKKDLHERVKDFLKSVLTDEAKQLLKELEGDEDV